jgi:hypothetical protein
MSAQRSTPAAPLKAPILADRSVAIQLEVQLICVVVIGGATASVTREFELI